MREHSCPATSEGPVLPYLGICGVPKVCSPAPEKSRDMQGQQGDSSLGLGVVGFLWEKWTWKEDAGMSWGSSSPPWAGAGRQQDEVK